MIKKASIKKTTLLYLSIFCLTITNFSYGQCVEQNLTTATGTITRHNEFRGQSFTATCSGVLSTIGIDFSSNETMNFLIYEGAGNTGTQLGSKLNYVVSNSSVGAIENIDISSLNINVVNGQQYTVYFDPTNAGGEIGYAFVTSNTYNGGSLYSSNNSLPWETRFSFLITPKKTETISFNYFVSTGNGGGVSNGPSGQSFTATASGKLSSFSFDFGSSETNNLINVNVYDGANNTILLGTLSNVDIISPSAGTFDLIDLSSLNINVISGQQYTVIVEKAAATSSMFIFENDPGTYSGGDLYYFGFETKDLNFAFKIEKPLINNNFNNTSGNNWSTVANWSNGLPTATDNIIINKDITIDTEDIILDNLTVNYGVSINVPTDKEITIEKDITNFGEISIASNATNSGVLFVKGTSTGTVTYNRGGLLANKWSIVTPPVSGQKILSFAQNTAVNNIRSNTTVSPVRYAIGAYDDNLSSKWQYFDANTNATDEFITGRSYSMSKATDGSVSFTGTLNLATTNLSIPADKWSLLGNPFTTYLPANENGGSSFLGDNISALDDNFKSIYMWDNSQNKYVAVTQVDGVNRALSPGQGFFVRMKIGQTSIVFNEDKRQVKPTAGISLFQKTNKTTPNIELFIDNGTVKVSTNIKYFSNATKGFDAGYDIGNFNGSNLDIFTHLIENNENVNYTIQSLPNTNLENMVIPVGIVANAGEFSITLNASNLPADYNIFLEDRENNTFTQLNEANSKYEVSFKSNINTTGRFFLHNTNAKVLGVNESELTGVTLYNTQNNNLKINGLQNEETQLLIYNLLGKEIYNINFIGKTDQTIPLSISITGVYIVKLKTEKGTLSRKIIIE